MSYRVIVKSVQDLPKGEQQPPIFYGRVSTEYGSKALLGVMLKDNCSHFCFWHFYNNQTFQCEHYLRVMQELWRSKRVSLVEDEKLVNDIYNVNVRTTSRQSGSLTILLNGTAFQQKVWKSLLQIPYGEVRTYQAVARDYIGKASAARAVAKAVASNNLAVLVPCHRVVRKDAVGRGLYRWGSALKLLILNMEQKQD